LPRSSELLEELDPDMKKHNGGRRWERLISGNAGTAAPRRKRPSGLKVKFLPGETYARLKEKLMEGQRLHTCAKAALSEHGGVLEFRDGDVMILGDTCTALVRFLRREDPGARGVFSIPMNRNPRRGKRSPGMEIRPRVITFRQPRQLPDAGCGALRGDDPAGAQSEIHRHHRSLESRDFPRVAWGSSPCDR